MTEDKQCKCGHPRSEHLLAYTHDRTPCMKVGAKGMDCRCRKFVDATPATGTKPTFANHDRETRFWLSTRDRADCRECAGHGCTFCFQTGKQLSREDLLLADSQADGEDSQFTGGSLYSSDSMAAVQRIGK